MQNSFNKYGENNFSFEVIIEINGENEIELLREIESIEQSYLDLDEEKFNISTSSKTPSNYIFYGKDNPFYGKKHTKESKELQRAAKLGKYEGKDNPFYGKKHTEENRRKFAKKAKETFKGVPKTEEQKLKMRLNSKRRMPVIINDIEYSSLREASSKTGECRKKISKKAKSDEFPNYKFISDERKV